MPVDEVAVRDIDEQRIAVVGRRRTQLVIATKQVKGGIQTALL